MKKLAIASLIIAIIGLAVGVYCQIVVMPDYNHLYEKSDLSPFERDMFYAYSDTKFMLGSIALFLGPLAVLPGVIAGIKKQKLGWIAAGAGLVSFLLGAIQSTHMFS
ncbi:MAG: hypothetical protein KDD41_04610 [Flavobacteriales bacterium]|nr:hypothetical protein [Flavobacteriales bacterium]